MAEMEKKKALQKAAGITTIEGLQQIVGDLMETTLPDVSIYILHEHPALLTGVGSSPPCNPWRAEVKQYSAIQPRAKGHTMELTLRERRSSQASIYDALERYRSRTSDTAGRLAGR